MVGGIWLTMNRWGLQHKEQCNYISSILYVVEQEFPTVCHISNKMQYGWQFFIVNNVAAYETLTVLVTLFCVSQKEI